MFKMMLKQPAELIKKDANLILSPLSSGLAEARWD
jgi:hypothetical protein